MPQITLTRDTCYIDLIRAYKIFINNEYYCSISDASTITIKTNETKITVQAKIDWCSSNVIKLDLSKNDEITLVIKPTLCSWRIILMPLYLSIYRNNYLELSKME